MKGVQAYTVNTKTISILPYLGTFGESFTLIVEFEKQYVVEMPQIKVLEMSFNHYGSSLRGAKDGTKAILGNVNMPPLTMHEMSGIYLFQVKSTVMAQSAWFNLMNVVQGVQCENDMNHVQCVDGRMIQVATDYRKINEKINQASGLKERLQKRAQMPSLVSEDKKVYLACQENKRNYEWTNKN